MRYKKHSLTLCIGTLIAMVLSSCSQGVLSEEGADNRPVLLQLQSLQTDGMSETATRALDYPTSRLIGFFMQANALSNYVACNNYKGAFSGTPGRWVSTPDIFLNANTAKIAVYAPYDPMQTTPEALNLTACLRPENDASKDIWCETFSATNSSILSSITLKHVYTRLILTVSRSAEYTAEALLTDITLEGNEIYPSATYNFFNNSEPYTYSGLLKFSTASIQMLDAEHTTAKYDMLLIPTRTLTGNITLTFTVNGQKMQTIIDKARFTISSNKLEAGKQYNVNLRLTPGKLKIVSVSLVDWDTLPALNGDITEYEQGFDFVPNFGTDVPGYENEETIINPDPLEI